MSESEVFDVWAKALSACSATLFPFCNTDVAEDVTLPALAVEGSKATLRPQRDMQCELQIDFCCFKPL